MKVVSNTLVHSEADRHSYDTVCGLSPESERSSGDLDLIPAHGADVLRLLVWTRELSLKESM